jgi:hypothetical protein
MPQKKLPPIHPGEILLEESLRPLGITQQCVAKNLHGQAEARRSTPRFGALNARRLIGFRQLAAFSPSEAALLAPLRSAIAGLLFSSQVRKIFGITSPTNKQRSFVIADK